jgi:TRAP-type C4-dicarboxylate transport system permease small subunit
MRHLKHILIDICGYLPLVMVWIGAISVLLMAGMLCYDVAMRYFFNAPKSWGIEIAQYLMLATLFLPLAYVQKEHRHIRVELLTSRLPMPYKGILDTIILPLLVLFVNGILLWQIGRLAVKLYIRGTVSATSLRIPLFPLSLILVLAFSASILVLVIQIVKGSKTGHRSGTDDNIIQGIR